MLDLVLNKKQGLAGNVKLNGSLGYSVHEMEDFKILGAARRVHSKHLELQESRFWPLQGSAQQSTMEQNPGGKRSPEKLVNIQGSPPPSSGVKKPGGLHG